MIVPPASSCLSKYLSTPCCTTALFSWLVAGDRSYPASTGGASDTLISFDATGWKSAVSASASQCESAHLTHWACKSPMPRSKSTSLLLQCYHPDSAGVRNVTAAFVEHRGNVDEMNDYIYMNHTDMIGALTAHVTCPTRRAARRREDQPKCQIWTFESPACSGCLLTNASHSCPTPNFTSGYTGRARICGWHPRGLKVFPLFAGETLDFRILQR